MNHYPHHIGDFNNATRHLTVVERAFYRELIELYYSTEKPLPTDDMDRLARRVMAQTEAEKAIIKAILAEFFYLDGDLYRHNRCDAELLIYKEKIDNAHKAGKASALVRAKQASNNRSTGVKRKLNGTSTHHSHTPSTIPKEVQDLDPPSQPINLSKYVGGKKR